MGDRQRLREFKFKITEPYSSNKYTTVRLIGWDEHWDGKELVTQLPRFLSWIYRWNIERAKRKIIKNYFRLVIKNKTWTEGCKSGAYADTSEKELLGVKDEDI